MIIKSNKNQVTAPTPTPQPPRIITRLKLHPSFSQDPTSSHISNLLIRKSSQSLFKDDSLKKSRKSQDESFRSRVLLKPVISRSTGKSLGRGENGSLLGTNRSDRRLLSLKNGACQRKETRLKDLVAGFDKSKDKTKGKDDGLRVRRMSTRQMNETQTCRDSEEEYVMDIQEQFYQQVKILQAFKELHRLTN